MPPEVDRTQKRIRSARILLVVLFVLLRVGDAGLVKFSFWMGNPLPLSRGVVLGGALVSTVLMVMLWRRRPWARYLLIGVNWVMVVVFCAAAMMLSGTGYGGLTEPVKAMAGGLVLYLLVNAVLIASNRIQRLATAPGVGG